MNAQIATANEMMADYSGRYFASSIENEAANREPRQSAHFGLNDVGDEVWQLIQTPQAVSMLLDAILLEYATSQGDSERDVRDLLVRMREHGLIEMAP